MSIAQDRFVLPPSASSCSTDFSDLEDSIFSLDSHYNHRPWLSFGNEAKAALLFRSGILAKIDFKDRAFLGYDPPSLDRFFLRAPLEPIAYSSWLRFLDWSIDEDWALKTVRCLVGRQAHFRTEDIVKPRMGHVSGNRYMAPADARRWLERLDLVRNDLAFSPLAEASVVYATVVIHHPMKDGNGRLARILFHATLANRLGLTAPFLPLGPVIYQSAPYFTHAVRKLAAEADWNNFFGVMHAVISHSASVVGSLNEKLKDNCLSGGLE